MIGLVAGVVCFWGVTGLKKMLGMDDALDVFGVHGVGGVVGALLTGVFASPSLGGIGICNYITNKCGDAADFPGIGAQVWIQFQAVMTAIVLSAIVSYVALLIVKADHRGSRDRGRGARGSRHDVPRRVGLQDVSPGPGSGRTRAPRLVVSP